MAANPISWADMAAWSQLTGRSLDPWDVTAIRCIDGEFMASTVDSPKKEDTSKPRKPNGR
jgi:hypothetical protein